MTKIPALVRLSSLIVLFCAATCFAQSSSYVTVSSPFYVDKLTSVPSHTLVPGNYSIRILDWLKDRFILRIDDHQGTPVATFIALRSADLTGSDTPGPILWASTPRKKTAAIRGYTFPNGTALEFVYPKDEAVLLAQRNDDTVPAIDPQSEGRPPDPKLSPEDREVVTLWLLSPTRVGPGKGTPAIEAKRFRAEPPPNSAATAEAAPRKSVTTPGPSPLPVVSAKTQGDLTPFSKAKTSVTRLPQTASELPMILMISLLLLGIGGGLPGLFCAS